jgi:hypothetical protein
MRPREANVLNSERMTAHPEVKPSYRLVIPNQPLFCNCFFGRQTGRLFGMTFVNAQGFRGKSPFAGAFAG